CRDTRNGVKRVENALMVLHGRIRQIFEARAYTQSQDVSGSKPERSFFDTQQRPQQKAGADQQSGRKSELSEDQQTRQALPASNECSSTANERAGQIAAKRLQHRREREEDCG